MIRRFFLRALTLAAVPTKPKGNLSQLVANYQRLFESVANVGESTVCYDRDTWNAIREAFRRIIEACSEK